MRSIEVIPKIWVEVATTHPTRNQTHGWFRFEFVFARQEVDDEDETALARRWKSGVLLDFLIFFRKKKKKKSAWVSMGFSATKKARDIIILYTIPASDLKGRDRCLYLHMFFLLSRDKKKLAAATASQR